MTKILGLPSKTVLAVTLALCSTACSVSQSPPEPEAATPYTLPALIEYNYRWSAEPGIDLFGSPETAVRAYLESYYIAGFAHSMAVGYPGFEKATEELVYDPPRDRSINDRTNYNGLPRTGTFYAHILSIQPVEHGFQAMVCEGTYSLTTATPEGTWRNFGTRIPRAILIDLAPGPAGTTDQVRTTDETGRAPQTDMFGGWTITRHEFSTRNFDDDLACENKFPDPPESRPTRVNDDLASPYPTLPPYPGWPVPTP